MSSWLWWSKALTEEGSIPTADAVLKMFCEHLSCASPGLFAGMQAPDQQQLRARIAEGYMP